MSRNNPPVDRDLTTDVDVRLDEIAQQLQNVAAGLHVALDRLVAGEIKAQELDSYRHAAETLVHAWELEADLLRRRPR